MSSIPDISAPRPTILIVDDETDILRLVEKILTEQGYDVILSRGAQNAINAFSRMARKPDLILTDVVMPGMSGPMLIDHLLAISQNLRVLFMSGYDERQVVQKYVVDKGFALIPKPFTPQQLAEAVKGALSKPLQGGTPA
ncbi:MAG: two-component system, cell cycle sensor histidine kinase and response regulator CckA [Bryobacterales bacterium]|jgi:two-component system cell cycle sensor histidine kinase/response regulator CckA|nr:two-component system, cell cycle sensor histidine kinase and response regulator CckA [Bryobacterales bacterium]